MQWRPPQNFLNFMQFFVKTWQICMLAPLQGESWIRLCDVSTYDVTDVYFSLKIITDLHYYTRAPH